MDISIFFQKTLDKRVVIFLRNLGFSVIETSNAKKNYIDKYCSIHSWAYSDGDSYCLINTNKFNILNLNDCLVDTPKKIKDIQKEILKISPKIDVLMSQFAYANWVGNIDEKSLREKATS